MPGLPTQMPFTLLRDTSNVPTAGYDSQNNLLGVEEWVIPPNGQPMFKPVDTNGYSLLNIAALQRTMAFSTTTTLGANVTYTGASIDGQLFRRITGRAFADQSGALNIQHSDDAITWDTLTTITVSANTAAKFDEPLYLRYLRISYSNGDTAQGAFRLSGYLCAV